MFQSLEYQATCPLIQQQFPRDILVNYLQIHRQIRSILTSYTSMLNADVSPRMSSLLCTEGQKRTPNLIPKEDPLFVLACIESW